LQRVAFTLRASAELRHGPFGSFSKTARAKRRQPAANRLHSRAMSETRVRLAELLGALSLSADLGAGVTDEAGIRTAVAVAHLAEACGASAVDASDAYYAALLRYIGCTGFAHEEALIGAGDDLALLATFESGDAARLHEMLAIAFARLARDAPPLERLRAVARFVLDPQGYAKLATAHCEQASTLARELGMGAGVTRALSESYERWDGRGQPNALRERELSLPARLLHIANAIEVHHRLGGPDAALQVVRARSGTQFEPELTGLVPARANALFADLAGARSWHALLDLEPKPQRSTARTALRELALAFAHYIDLKSPYTLGHSTGVAALVERAAQGLGWDAAAVERVVLAALLHDLGRASVPNGIWDKPAALGLAERERVRLHSYQSERVLRRSALLDEVAEIVALHHERLDGSGYHRGARAAELGAESRLLQAADVYHALIEERAHRPAHSPEAAARVLSEEVRSGRLDRAACDALLAAAGHAALGVRPATPDGLSERELEVLVLLARGLSNQVIGQRLFISPKTVKNHVAHIYAKTGVKTRAAAALYAVSRGLLAKP
jgi:putative nucleotidyltransferase with HDIG domain